MTHNDIVQKLWHLFDVLRGDGINDSGYTTEQWRAENPELISGENSAEALLARIKAEREALKPNKKTRRVKA